jgi:hypothetical protein
VSVLAHGLAYFIKHETKDKKCCTENELTSMLEFLTDNIFVEFGWHIFRHPFIFFVLVNVLHVLPASIYGFLLSPSYFHTCIFSMYHSKYKAHLSLPFLSLFCFYDSINYRVTASDVKRLC